ncbi:hypothetical protein [Geminicoccus roseus]|uniref:hypothetical protein n=1 Tax=Geminicoccus roseus TaxID=404900 RepID=UPI0012F72383|nr:hypothetical protein [Geminicoccus roseus]
MIKERRAKVRAEAETLWGCLDETERSALQRAESGLPLTMLDHNQYPDQAGENALRVIRSTIEKLCASYEEVPRPAGHWPDLRGDLRALQARLDDLDESRRTGQEDNAIGRAIAIGAAFSRLGFWLISASDAAGGAKQRADGVSNGRKATVAREHKFRAEICAEAEEIRQRHPTYSRNRIAVDLGKKFGVSKDTIYPWLTELGL